MATPNRSPMRVLIRPPPSSTLPPPSPPPSTTYPSPSLPSLPPLHPPASSPSPHGGVVVVGFVGKRNGDTTQLINRIIDSNVFGYSRSCEVEFGVGKDEVTEEVKDWFKRRRISYYHDEVKGILYLQFSPTKCPVAGGFQEVQPGFGSVLEEHEFGDLQGMLFMFSVCHVIIFLQEGSRFDIQVLKKFRVLQAAKLAMFSFVRSQTSLPLTSRSQPSSSSRASPSGASSKNRSPGKSTHIMNHNSSSVALMSGLGSYASLLPGQCTPVILFAFLDDFSDFGPGSSLEESVETSSVNQSSSLTSLARPSLPVKGAGSVVVLSRPVSKSEGGFRKKLQSSLEAQIRFSIKKCRVLTGSETGHVRARSGNITNSAPLFSLDASKAVALVDRLSNQRGQSLEFATRLVENILNGVTTSDSLLLESHSQSANREDILSVKDFIYRQCDILRGRGGTVSNANTVSAGGVGMVAVAAAAAAASAASGKTFTMPELPSLEIWLSSSQLILYRLLSAKHGSVLETETSKRKPRSRNNIPSATEGNASKVTDSLDVAVSYLDNSRGLNIKFSRMWCERALPVAKDVYLKDLPTCYPTSQHKAHLEKALCAFKSIVKGPAVQYYLKKLEDECTSIWSSGRQLCDSVSLTGKQCIHQRHDVEASSHSSGFVFLHACACGRSRKLCSDPFDFETANLTFSCYPDCDKLLPALQLPGGCARGPIQSSSWSLIRIGGARYYQPSKGLLQSGFCATEKFLLRLKIFPEKQMHISSSSSSIVQGDYVNGVSDKLRVESVQDANVKKIGFPELHSGEMQNGVDSHREPTSEIINSDDNKINFVRGFPNFTMRKPFSEVVAGPAATDSGFPPLQSKAQVLLGSEKGIKQASAVDTSAEKVKETTGYQGDKKVENISFIQETVNENGSIEGNSLLNADNNKVPLIMNNRKLHTSLQHAVLYVGFEHECPHGHRFILMPEHLNGLGSTYEVHEDSPLHSSLENADRRVADTSKGGKNSGHGKVHRHSNRMISTANKVRHPGKSKEVATNINSGLDGMLQSSQSAKEQNGMQTLVDSVKDMQGTLQSMTLDDTDGAFSLLNRNLPLYLNCPHCESHRDKMDMPNVKFAGTISQLQRIFLVTPPFPVVLSTCPVVQFEASCLPPSVLDREQKLQFSLGCPVILPPESFLSLRLPFIYGVQLDDGSPFPLKPFENQPELTAWITKSTTLQVLGKGSNPNKI